MTMTVQPTSETEIRAMAIRIGASVEDVREVCQDRLTLERTIRERGVSEDMAAFLIIANRRVDRMMNDSGVE